MTRRGLLKTAVAVVFGVALSVVCASTAFGQVGRGAVDASGVADPAAVAKGVEVTFEPGHVNLLVGDRFTLQSRVTNNGGTASQPLLAHLNVASLTNDVYVDPEDWSSSRSKQVPSVKPGDSVTLSWDLQAVNSGTFDIYVALMPNDGRSAGTGPVLVSPPVFAEIGGRQTADPGGALPVVLGIPALLGLAILGSRYRLRRTR